MVDFGFGVVGCKCAHIEAVSDDEVLVAELVSEQIGGDFVGEGGRGGVAGDLGDGDVGYHDEFGTLFDGVFEGN